MRRASPGTRRSREGEGGEGRKSRSRGKVMGRLRPGEWQAGRAGEAGEVTERSVTLTAVHMQLVLFVHMNESGERRRRRHAIERM